MRDYAKEWEKLSDYYKDKIWNSLYSKDYPQPRYTLEAQRRAKIIEDRKSKEPLAIKMYTVLEEKNWFAKTNTAIIYPHQSGKKEKQRYSKEMITSVVFAVRLTISMSTI